MKKKFYILALTFFCILCSQASFGQNLNEGIDGGWLNAVPVYAPPRTPPPPPPCYSCACNPSLCIVPIVPPVPCYSCACDPSRCFGGSTGGGGNPPPPSNNCTTTCPAGYTQNKDCSCIKKVDNDCKKFKTGTNIPSNSNTFQKGDVVTFNGPFYFSDLNKIPTGLSDKTGNIVRADIVAGYQILQHGNYYEIPSISYKYNQFSYIFNGGDLGGFKGGDCPDTGTSPNPTGTYGNSGAFDSKSPCDPSSSAFNICVCNPVSCGGGPTVGGGNPTGPPCTQTCTITQSTTLGKIAGGLCPCGDNPKKLWYIDKDGDGFDSGTKYIDIFFANPGPQYKLITFGPDCDDDNKDVQKLNKCKKCEVEPVSGVCDLPCNTFAERIKDILAHEGGYVNNPNDPGKETNKGITIAVWQKNAQSLLNIEPTSANLKALTNDQAAVIYKALYWDKIQSEDIADGDIRYLLFDFYVNAGGNAAKVMQKTLNQLGNNLSIDGVVGNGTINAINNADPVQLYNNFKANRQQYYNNLANRSAKMATFLDGWTNRVNKFNNKTTTNNKNVNCN